MPQIPTSNYKPIQQTAATIPQLHGIAVPHRQTGIEAGIKTLAVAESISAKVYQDEKQRIDRLRLMEEEQAIYNEFEVPVFQGITDAKGQNAIGVSDEVDKGLTEFTAKRMAGLSNDEQRVSYQALVNRTRESVRNRAMQHEANQTELWEKSVYVGEKKRLENQASEDPNGIKTYAGKIAENIKAQGERMGEDPLKTEMDIVDGQEKLYANAFTSVIQSGDAIGLRRYYEEHKTHLAPEKKTSVLKILDNMEQEQTAFGLANEAIKQFTPKDEFNPIDSGKAEEYLRAQAGGKKGIYMDAMAEVNSASLARDKSIKARKEANLDVLWSAFEKGRQPSAIRKMPEYSTGLSGSDRHDFSEKMKDVVNKAHQREKMTPEEKEALTVQQTVNLLDMASNADALTSKSITEAMVSRDISVDGAKTLSALANPLKRVEIQDQLKRLNDAKRARLLDPTDRVLNDKIWASYNETLHKFIQANPKEDIESFVDKMLEPNETGWLFGLVGGETPEEAFKRKTAELKKPMGTEAAGEEPAGKKLDEATARDFYRRAGKDVKKARLLARKAGYSL